jgi:hypothetical protein
MRGYVVADSCAVVGGCGDAAKPDKRRRPEHLGAPHRADAAALLDDARARAAVGHRADHRPHADHSAGPRGEGAADGQQRGQRRWTARKHWLIAPRKRLIRLCFLEREKGFEPSSGSVCKLAVVFGFRGIRERVRRVRADRRGRGSRRWSARVDRVRGEILETGGEGADSLAVVSRAPARAISSSLSRRTVDATLPGEKLLESELVHGARGSRIEQHERSRRSASEAQTVMRRPPRKRG